MRTVNGCGLNRWTVPLRRKCGQQTGRPEPTRVRALFILETPCRRQPVNALITMPPDYSRSMTETAGTPRTSTQKDVDNEPNTERT
jgi:hypothetical protein